MEFHQEIAKIEENFVQIQKGVNVNVLPVLPLNYIRGGNSEGSSYKTPANPTVNASSNVVISI